MDLEVRHLRLVRAVAACGGLTRAGRALHLTQSALSHQLRAVETRLGTPIFLRVGKRMVLTSAGERLRASADDILGTLERTEDAIRGLAGGRGGRLRVSTGSYTEYHWLPQALKRFHAACPDVDVQIVAGAGDDAVDLLVDGAADLALVHHPVDDGRVLVRPLFQDELVAVVGPAHRFRSKRFVTPDDFANETVLLDVPADTHGMVQELFGRTGSRFANVRLVAPTSAMLELAGAGLGVALVARWAVPPDRGLRAVSVTAAGFPMQWSALLLKESGSLGYVAEFLAAISGAIGRPVRQAGKSRIV